MPAHKNRTRSFTEPIAVIATAKELKHKTKEFFRFHWQVDEKEPSWTSWKLHNNPFPSEIKSSGGCYAIFEGSKLVYVGVTTTEGRGKNADKRKVGLFHRLRRHIIRPDPEKRGASIYVHKKDKWRKITEIRLIGFPGKYRYMAAALELYLIRELKPPKNKAT